MTPAAIPVRKNATSEASILILPISSICIAKPSQRDLSFVKHAVVPVL